MELKISLTRDEIKRLANIMDNAGQVVLGTIVLPGILNAVDQNSLTMLTLVGIPTCTLCWWLSLRLERIS